MFEYYLIALKDLWTLRSEKKEESRTYIVELNGPIVNYIFFFTVLKPIRGLRVQIHLHEINI